MRRPLRLAIPDFISASLLAAIVAEIRASAPEAQVVLASVRSESHGADLLESGHADVLIESNEIRSATVRHATLFEDSILAVAARRHPQVRDGLSIEEYLQLAHAAAAPASGTRPGMIDRMLSERLRELEATGLIRREVIPEIPVRVEYYLTPHGEMVRPVVDAIGSWAAEWMER